MTAHILTPYPGTKLHEDLAAQGRIFDTDPTHYSTAHVVFTPAGMTVSELERGYLWMYEAFYSWGSILRRLPADRSQVVPYLLFNVFYRKYGRLTARLAELGWLGGIGRLARRLSYRVR